MSPLRIPHASPLSKALGLTVTRRQKFNARRTEVDGITFDSQKEANHYAQLLQLVRLGEIDQLQIQPRFELHARGARDPIGAYVADFRYRVVASERWKVIDCKGYRTPLYRWKKKHTELEYGVQIVEV